MLESLSALAVAFTLSVLGTKVAHPLGEALGVVDTPNCRKVHCEPTPRSGGLLLIPALLASLFTVTWLFPGSQLQKLLSHPQMPFVGAGLIVIYLLGAVDDKYHLPSLFKFVMQIAAVSIVYAGGVKIQTVNLFSFALPMGAGLTSYFATLFWCLLIINAINLIDGLDGLAAGMILFTSIVIAGFSLFRERMDLVVFYAAMSGAMLGFLIYNFNPATIFLGDCGSCSLGFIVATMSLITGTKSQVGTTLAIPLITLGIPVFDAILSGIRRFVLGRNPFSADKGHVHHRLLDSGMTQRRVVIILYGLTVLFAGLSILAIVGKQKVSAVAIVCVFIVLALVFKKLKYFEQIAVDKIYGWFRDLIDVAGISHTRRGFLGLQHAIAKSNNIDEVWDNISEALEFIRMDYAEANLCVRTEDRFQMNDACSISGLAMDGLACPDGAESDERKTVRFFWSAKGFDLAVEQRRRGLMKMECPLVWKGYSWGTLWLVKDLKRQNLTQFTLRRIEQLRRTLIAKMNDLNGIE